MYKKRALLFFLSLILFFSLSLFNPFKIYAAPFQGTFIHIPNTSEAEIIPVIEEIASLEMDTIIISQTKLKSGNCSEPLYLWYPDIYTKLTKILDKAADKNISVYIGLIQPESICPDYFGTDAILFDSIATQEALSQLHNLYSSHPALKGWYIPLEPSLGYYHSLNDPIFENIYSYYQSLTNRIRSISPLPIIVSPILGGAHNKTPTEIAERARIFQERTGVTIQTWQDNAGQAYPIDIGWDNLSYTLKNYFDAISNAIGGENFWSTTELFTCCSLDIYRAAPLMRIRKQSEMAQQASKHITWIQPTLMGKADDQHRLEAERLLAGYRALFLNKGEYMISPTYTWTTPPSLQYPDVNNELFNEKVADPRNFSNDEWVGVINEAIFKIDLGSPKNIDYVGTHLLQNSEQGIIFPDLLELSCSLDNQNWMISNHPFPITKTDGEYVFSNSVELNQNCQYIQARLTGPQWIFLSEAEIITEESSVNTLEKIGKLLNYYGQPETLLEESFAVPDGKINMLDISLQ